jgi:hypothetical protein
MFTDDDLTRLLGEAAGSFAVPDVVVEQPAQKPRQVPVRRWLQGSGIAAALLVGVVLLQSGPGGTSTGTSSKSSSVAPTAQVAAGIPQPLPRVGHLAPGGADAVTSPGKADAADTGEARVVKTGTVTLLADKGKVQATIASVKRELTKAHGYIASEDSQPIGTDPTATVTMRVPVGAFDALEQRLQNLGVKVVSVTSSGKDVTASYADTAAQIGSLKAARERFLTILSGAKTIGETLTVQQRVDDVQSQIDRLEGQRRLLANQSDLATLTVAVSEKAPVVKASTPGGLNRAWDRATHGFTSGVEGLIAHSGRALLVLIVGLLGFVVLRVGWRLARRSLL